MVNIGTNLELIQHPRSTALGDYDWFDIEQAGTFQHEERPKPLAATKRAIPHGVPQGRLRTHRRRQQAVDRRLDPRRRPSHRLIQLRCHRRLDQD